MAGLAFDDVPLEEPGNEEGSGEALLQIFFFKVQH